MRFRQLALLCILFSCTDGSDSSEVSQGNGGSLTRFAIKDSYLYIVTGFTINVYTLEDGNFNEVNSVSIGFGLETIQANGDFLYLGANDAMYIYSIADRTRPEFVFRYTHIVSCDPVVVQGNRAYVTLRTGNACNLGVNMLEIIDISNPFSPQLLTQYLMNSPGGLGISGTCLFVCEGEAGLKMLDVTHDEVTELLELPEVNAYDVIVRSNSFILTGEDGIFQYDYTCTPPSLQLKSTIPVQRAVF
jgi:hypothetical protein